MQLRISFRSRSDLVLGADHAFNFLSISLFKRASRFRVFKTKVAPECFCLVRLKMPLLIWANLRLKASNAEEEQYILLYGSVCVMVRHQKLL